MDSSILQFINGVPGYAPQGSKGNDGKDGYSIYYSSFGSDDKSVGTMISMIKNKKVLSSNDNYMSNEVVEYKDNDMIMTNDASIFIISGIGNNASLKHIGSIKKVLRNQDTTPFSEYKSIELLCSKSVSDQTAKQNYNYNKNNIASPLWHHRDANDSSMYGNTVTIVDVDDTFNNKLGQVDGGKCTLVLNFRDGLRFEKILTVSNVKDKIFIENGYLYPYGHIDNISIYNKNTRFQTYDEEKNASANSSTHASNIMVKNLLTENPSKSLCDGYIAYYYKQQEYRIPVKISQQH